MADQATSGTRVIIGEALNRLKDRERKLDEVATRTTDERTEARAFIKAIEKALGGKPTPQQQLREERDLQRQREERLDAQGANSPRAKFTDKVIALVTDSPRSVQSIADHFGSSVAYVAGIVNQSVRLRVDVAGVVSVTA